MNQPNTSRSNSTSKGVSIFGKIYEWGRHFGMRWRGRGSADRVASSLDQSVSEYDAIYTETTGRNLREGRLLEIGYGARPLRMFWLTSLGYDVQGVDLDRPVLMGSFREFFEMLRKNGVQRVLKSIIRHFVFDRSEWRALDRQLKIRREKGLMIEQERFTVADAATLNFAAMYPSGVDFIYSEDVFEHVPGEALARLLENLARVLAPEGCAVFRPHVFSSIGGGHLPEWYPHLTRTRPTNDPDCRSEPWEHLRKRRFKANTYLNELKIEDYRRMIGRYFEIVSETNEEPELGSRFLTAEISSELPNYTKDELLLNNVRFVCRARRGDKA